MYTKASYVFTPACIHNKWKQLVAKSFHPLHLSHRQLKLTLRILTRMLSCDRPCTDCASMIWCSFSPMVSVWFTTWFELMYHQPFNRKMSFLWLLRVMTLHFSLRKWPLLVPLQMNAIVPILYIYCLGSKIILVLFVLCISAPIPEVTRLVLQGMMQFCLTSDRPHF